jgi:hypothetical protein
MPEEVSMKRALILASTMLAACAHEPFSYLDGQPFSRVDPHIYPVQIVQVDGSSYYRDNPVLVQPGEHSIMVAARPAKHSRLAEQRVLKLKVEPCVRYIIGAHRESNLLNDFVPVVLETRPISGCDASALVGSVPPPALVLGSAT